MPRVGLDADAVIACGAEILDEGGAADLSLAVVAARLGVKAPSLYKHVDGLPGLRRGVALAAKAEFEEVLGRAVRGRSGADAVRAIAAAYRAWAREHPARYALTVRAPAPDDPQDQAVSAALAQVVFDVLAAYGLAGEDAVDATRFLRSSLHGFVTLETAGAFALPVDPDASFGRMVDRLDASLVDSGR
ncbi:TetR-like C-terminal domain-containing protein [Microbacterium sp. SSW1-59]|uniref:TetR/AcrR family transcriptional regulator n=1 Tax=Microbacterium xanthum TaxID=3079794 RepID=UPI002AD475A0|nr:TetR-like C-terminal domain-containing protein [Microbacterium sp. SSW1-59]MDZ8202240.1 TetR-like C-terminal domain-containing protein [Microbacterium sp. SSW1-59]